MENLPLCEGKIPFLQNDLDRRLCCVGNPPLKNYASEVECSPGWLKEILREDIAFCRQSNHGFPQASRGWSACARAVQRAWHKFQFGHVIQMAYQVRRHGRLADARLRELEEENRRFKKCTLKSGSKPEPSRTPWQKSGEAISATRDGAGRGSLRSVQDHT